MPWDGKLEQAVKIIGNFSNRITVMMLAVLKKLLGMYAEGKGKRGRMKDEGEGGQATHHNNMRILSCLYVIQVHTR
jgi:hypothetical protein